MQCFEQTCCTVIPNHRNPNRGVVWQGSDPQDDALRTAIRAVQDIGQLFVTAAGAALAACLACSASLPLRDSIC